MTETILFNTAKMRAAVDEQSSPEDKLLACIYCELESITTSETVEAMSVLVSEWRSLSDESQTDILILRDLYEACWMESLASARDQGLIEGDIFIVRRFLTGAINWTTNWYHADGDISLKELAQQALHFACKTSSNHQQSSQQGHDHE